jgi:hypothetical protein
VKKKYIAKTEKILIDLENVFIKYADREQIYRKVGCNFTKMKPGDVKF